VLVLVWVAQVTLRADPASAEPAFSVLTYNVGGNGATNWSTNMPQVQAVGRQLQYLRPDIIAFNEIPYKYTWQMTNFVAAYLPGYYLATNSGTDGYLRSAIASRFPILFSQSWLDGAGLASFGYTGNYTRDLFQAQVAVPGFPQPLDVFVTHLKATTASSPQTDANRRAAEASAVSNFLATTFLAGTNALHPYLLCGDLNEDIARPDTNRYTSGQPIQRLLGPATGLQLTTPVNPFTRSELTLSIQTTLDVRFDYLLPCGLLSSNIVSSQVFRSDSVPAPPAPLLATDSETASDHLPVMMVFGNPYAKPFRLTTLFCTNQLVRLEWDAVRGQSYRVETSSNMVSWSVLASPLVATNARFTLATNLSGAMRFFRVQRLP
jgi:endonuclease/exonuclease/phosphatase family metal-dependent hydrolase